MYDCQQVLKDMLYRLTVTAQKLDHQLKMNIRLQNTAYTKKGMILSYGDRRLYIYENFNVGALGSITLSGSMPSNVSRISNIDKSGVQDKVE